MPEAGETPKGIFGRLKNLLGKSAPPAKEPSQTNPEPTSAPSAAIERQKAMAKRAERQRRAMEQYAAEQLRGQAGPPEVQTPTGEKLKEGIAQVGAKQTLEQAQKIKEQPQEAPAEKTYPWVKGLEEQANSPVSEEQSDTTWADKVLNQPEPKDQEVETFLKQKSTSPTPPEKNKPKTLEPVRPQKGITSEQKARLARSVSNFAKKMKQE